MFLGPRRPPGVHGRPLLRESGKANGTGDIVTSTTTHGAYEGGADQAAEVYEGYRPCSLKMSPTSSPTASPVRHT
ncbi:hypothetical protein [Corynebacterium terpenotabidum]|uniref:hypothetical protein n=1 Tax=Corynebacterium terpenotabidum TaxID=89154 RepID=UPI001B7FE592|nr:hypothetical protein [Corynebacterium terpenotabidum]